MLIAIPITIMLSTLLLSVVVAAAMKETRLAGLHSTFDVTVPSLRLSLIQELALHLMLVPVSKFLMSNVNSPLSSFSIPTWTFHGAQILIGDRPHRRPQKISQIPVQRSNSRILQKMTMLFAFLRR